MVDAEEDDVAASLQVMFVVELEFQSESTIAEEIVEGWILDAFAGEEGLLFIDSLQQKGDGAFSASTVIDNGVSAPAPSGLGVEVAEQSSPTLPN